MTEADMEAMTLRERILYQQIHPFKLATDRSTGVMAALFFWRHRWSAWHHQWLYQHS